MPIYTPPPPNITMPSPDVINQSAIVARYENISFIYRTPIDFLSLAMGDFWSLFLYFIIMIAVVVKFKNPLPIAFASLLTSLMLIPISPFSVKPLFIMIAAFSLTAATYLFIKR